MKQHKPTAVNWLIESLEKLEYNLEKGIISLDEYIINVKWVKDQAKAMEKEQIKEAFKHGELPPLFVNFDAEEYYNKTYIK